MPQYHALDNIVDSLSSNCTVRSASQSGEEKAYMSRFMSKGMSGGTYVEIGALNGHTFSNTRVLSKCHGWRGLLFEANLENYRNLLRRIDRPNVVIARHSAVCEPPQRWTTFTRDGGAVATDTSRVSKSFAKRWAFQNHPNETVQVPCAPMYELLGDIQHVDFFSLDVEGAEFSVVSTIDFRRVRIDTFCIELDGHDKAKEKRVVDLLKREGYERCAAKDGQGEAFRRNGWFSRMGC